MNKHQHIDPETNYAVRHFMDLVAGRYETAGAILYGSRARGTHQPDSDADVAVLMKGEHQQLLKASLELADAAYEVLLETRINVTPLPIWLDEWQRPDTYSNPSLLYNIARDGIRL